MVKRNVIQLPKSAFAIIIIAIVGLFALIVVNGNYNCRVFGK